MKTAATLFRKLCYKHREQTIAGIICAGWDKRNGGQVRREREEGQDTGVQADSVLLL